MADFPKIIEKIDAWFGLKPLTETANELDTLSRPSNQPYDGERIFRTVLIGRISNVARMAIGVNFRAGGNLSDEMATWLGRGLWNDEEWRIRGLTDIVVPTPRS